MKKRIISIFISLFIFVILISGSAINIYASSPCNWYCVHVKDNKQPRCDPSLSFVENYGGYYIDKDHGDDCDDKVVYLTFDAGYENGNVKIIADTLKEENVSGAFFVLGNFIEKNPELVRQLSEGGSLICNHTYSHKDMTKVSKEEFLAELKKLEDTCKSCTDSVQMSKYYRPPQGTFNEENLKWASEAGYKTIFWSFAYADWDNNKQMSSESAKKKILDNIHNGAVILLHPTSATNAKILKDVIVELKSMGYRFGTLDELTAEQSNG